MPTGYTALVEDGTVTELRDYMLRTTGSPLPLVEDRDVAEDAGPGTSPRRLHRCEPSHGEHYRNIQRHGFDIVELQTLTIWKGPLIQVPLGGTIRILDDLAILHPSQACDSLGVFQVRQQIEQQLLAVATTDKIDFGTL